MASCTSPVGIAKSCALDATKGESSFKACLWKEAKGCKSLAEKGIKDPEGLWNTVKNKCKVG